MFGKLFFKMKCFLLALKILLVLVLNKLFLVPSELDFKTQSYRRNWFVEIRKQISDVTLLMNCELCVRFNLIKCESCKIGKAQYCYSQFH